MKAVNRWLIEIIDVVVTPWPSTPVDMRMSHIIDDLQAWFPAAPWCLLDTLIPYTIAVLGFVISYKTWKAVWP